MNRFSTVHSVHHQLAVNVKALFNQVDYRQHDRDQYQGSQAKPPPARAGLVRDTDGITLSRIKIALKVESKSHVMESPNQSCCMPIPRFRTCQVSPCHSDFNSMEFRRTHGEKLLTRCHCFPKSPHAANLCDIHGVSTSPKSGAPRNKTTKERQDASPAVRENKLTARNSVPYLHRFHHTSRLPRLLRGPIDATNQSYPVKLR